MRETFHADPPPRTTLLAFLEEATVRRYGPGQLSGATVSTTIFKICDEAAWRAAERTGVFRGAPVDLSDGFIHFSTAAQVAETAARHFAGVDGLVLVAVDADALGAGLKWEPSRGGDLFPHLYGELPLAGTVRWVKPLPRGADGRHMFPAEYLLTEPTP